MTNSENRAYIDEQDFNQQVVVSIPWLQDKDIIWKEMSVLSSWSPSAPPPKTFVCGYCGNLVSSIVGFSAKRRVAGGFSGEAHIYICPHCNRPTLSFPGEPFSPAPKPGDAIANLPSEIQSIYEEVRSSIQAGAYTGAVMLCRTLITHIAQTELGASAKDTFTANIELLDKSHWIPPKGKHWVDHIKKMGNNATHNLKVFTEGEAKEILDFTAMLLKFGYDFANRLPAPPTP